MLGSFDRCKYMNVWMNVIMNIWGILILKMNICEWGMLMLGVNVLIGANIWMNVKKC